MRTQQQQSGIMLQRWCESGKLAYNNKNIILKLTMQEGILTQSNRLTLGQINLKIPKNCKTTLKLYGTKTERKILIEKKKNYAEAIRERNLNFSVNLNHNKNSYVETHQERNLNSSVNLNGNNKHNNSKRKKNTQQNQRGCCLQKNNLRNKSTLYDRRHNENISKINQKKTREKPLNQTCPISYLTKSNTQNLQCGTINTLECSNQPNAIEQNQIVLCSQIVNIQISCKDDQKQMLIKQNQTFKKDLASFRKQSNTLKKQLQKSQRIMSQLEQLTVNILDKGRKSKFSCIESIRNQGDKDLVIRNLQQQIQGLYDNLQNAKLEFLAREKKISDETSSYKKQMIKEAGIWQDKYLELVNLKHKNNQLRENQLIEDELEKFTKQTGQ